MGEREERFARLFAFAYGPVWAYASRRVPADEVDDVVADVFTVAWRRLEEIPGARVLPWLYRVAHHTVANHLRSHRRRLRLLKRIADQPRTAEPAGSGAALEALAALAPADQEVLRLAAWEELGASDIAHVLGCSVNAAALRLSRARKRFRERMTESGLARTSPRRKETDA